MSAYGKEFQERRAAEIAAQEKEERDRKRANDQARKQYLARLEEERQAQRDKDEAAIEEQLWSLKERARREWLYNHPERTSTEFEENAWPHMKATILELQRERLLQNEIEVQRRRMYCG